MKTETLIFQIRPSSLSNDFLKTDGEVWNPWLKRQTGFLQKSHKVVQRKDHAEVTLIISWKSLEDLRYASLKKKEIKNLDAEMMRKFSGTFNLVHSRIS